MQDVIGLIYTKRYYEASLYGDATSDHMARMNEDCDVYTKNITYISNTWYWTATSWGNIATFIFYGSKFQNKKKEVIRLKQVLESLSYYELFS